MVPRQHPFVDWNTGARRVELSRSRGSASILQPPKGYVGDHDSLVRRAREILHLLETAREPKTASRRSPFSREISAIALRMPMLSSPCATKFAPFIIASAIIAPRIGFWVVMILVNFT